MDLFSKEIEQELSKLFEEIANKIGNQVGQKCLDSLQEQYKKIWKSFENQINDLLKSLSDNIGRHSNLNQSIIQSKDDLIHTLEQFKNQASNAIQLSLQKFETTLLQNLNDAVYKKMFEVIQANIEKIAMNLYQLVEDLQRELDTFHKNSQATLARTEQSSEQKLASMLGEMKTTVENVCTQLSNMIQKNEERSKTSLATLETNFAALNLAITQKLDAWDTKFKEWESITRQDCQTLNAETRKIVYDWDQETRKVLQAWDQENRERISQVDTHIRQTIEQLVATHEQKLSTALANTQAQWQEQSNHIAADIQQFRTEGSQTLQSLHSFQANLQGNLTKQFSLQQNDIVRMESQIKEQQNCLNSAHLKIQVLMYSNLAALAGVIATVVLLIVYR